MATSNEITENIEANYKLIIVMFFPVVFVIVVLAVVLRLCLR